MIRGEKFSVNALLDVEILGFYPAGEQQDGKAKYVCTINGYKMTTGADFLESLKANEKVDADLKAPSNRIVERINKEEKKEVKKSGRKRKTNA